MSTGTPSTGSRRRRADEPKEDEPFPTALKLQRRKAADGAPGAIVRPRPEPAVKTLLLDIAMEGSVMKRADTRFFTPLQPRYMVLLLGAVRELRYYHRVLETRFGNCPVGSSVSIPLESIVDVDVPARGPTPSTFVLHVARLKGTRFPRSVLLGEVADGRTPAQLPEEKAARLRAGGGVEPIEADRDARARVIGPINTVESVHRSYTISAPSVDERARWVDILRDACPHIRRRGETP